MTISKQNMARQDKLLFLKCQRFGVGMLDFMYQSEILLLQELEEESVYDRAYRTPYLTHTGIAYSGEHTALLAVELADSKAIARYRIKKLEEVMKRYKEGVENGQRPGAPELFSEEVQRPAGGNSSVAVAAIGQERTQEAHAV